MSNQCRNCGRDVNNNYTPYTNAYGKKTNTKSDSSSAKVAHSLSSSSTASMAAAQQQSQSSVSGTAAAGDASIASNQITAKVMFGTVGAINELREKEQAEKNSAARAGRRQ